MTQISQNNVRHLAQLSSLQLNDDEVNSLQQDIEGILKYIEQLSELNTVNIKPTYQVTDLENMWREDNLVENEVTREQLLALASETANNQVKVPKVL